MGRPRQPLRGRSSQGNPRRRRACDRRTQQRQAPGRDPRKRRPMDGPPVDQESRAAVVSPARQRADPGRLARLLRQGADQVLASVGRRTQGSRRAHRAAGRRPPRQLHRQGRDPDAVVRQHRRLCRRRHHGRHLGHRRLLRADRRQRPPFGRRRHRRRAGAAPGRPDHHRGQLLHRRPLRGGRGRGGRGELGSLDGRLYRPEHPHLRPRHRRGELRTRASGLGGHQRHPAQGRRQVQPVRGDHREAGRRADAQEDLAQRPAARLRRFFSTEGRPRWPLRPRRPHRRP
ncbi:hypothetical protein VARIO8X_90121 [Burkholderiales bacterium 8X]|nr:hypothetical protein VARIO8X_90121 [Burkholderiales bacterium 8X]